MRTVSEIYEHYRIPPWLQMHQLRVAAVGKTVAERIEGTDTSAVVLCCLFHDMGNILKFDLRSSAPLASMIPDGERAYWINVQKEYEAAYGSNEHRATEAIAREIGLPPVVLSLIRDMGFSKAASILQGSRLELFAVEYADQRVGPMGVLSLEDRLSDGNRRYAGRYGQATTEEQVPYKENVEALYCIEDRLMELAQMVPKAINDVSIAPTINELQSFRI
jgi:hypothetical protein